MDIVVAHEGGEAAGIVQKTVAEHTGIPVITSQNAAQLNRDVTDLLEGATALLERQDKSADSLTTKVVGNHKKETSSWMSLFWYGFAAQNRSPAGGGDWTRAGKIMYNKLRKLKKA